MQLGAIADDLTGATDLAIALTNAGFATVVVPEAGLVQPTREQDPSTADAIVVALKTRTSSVQDAVDRSLRALHWLQSKGCDQFYFKYCSTFDSTPAGNIGPVADHLLDALNARLTIVAPAFPATGRTVYQGNLFVYEKPLHESSLREHPLTPMRDSNIARLLAPQVREDSAIELLDLDTIMRGTEAVKARVRAALDAGTRYLVADSVNETNLKTLAQACGDMPLITGGSGLAQGLSGPHDSGAVEVTPHSGRRVVLCGSASRTTQAQIRHALGTGRGIKIDTTLLRRNTSAAITDILHNILNGDPDTLTVVYATATPDDLVSSNDAELIEHCLSSLAVKLNREESVTGLLIAGGETSGAVVDALGITAMSVGPQLAPGVAWVQAPNPENDGLALVLKSGNFGTEDLFTRAWSEKV
ncbi:3-oxo-tetronate kinase [Nesterenkonia halotolerans]|uniref:3-oxo-tetronate kinase n=2 Tax=Nesterenkonia halotolerans TaxID=225325 RepID=A0ABR9J796_9MICC|nr:3-oxo-tetronate kinase [Nesterenkonia halotolerans]MBE1514451.1 uncharacterized protein YgbK (DUF1537 family) [Nesterenkonia halotolerans]